MGDISYGPLILSIKVASIATLIVFITGTALARLFARHEFPGKTVIEALFLLPLVLPPTVVGFGLLMLFGKEQLLGKLLYDYAHLQIVFSWIGAVIASTVVAFPLMYQSASASFKQIDGKLESAAHTLGASKWRVFKTITLPLAWPGLLAGFVLTFARALGEFGATLMIAGYIPGRTDTIPMAIYFAVEAGDMPTATFWVIIIVALGFSTILWLSWWSNRNLRRFTVKRKGGSIRNV